MIWKTQNCSPWRRKAHVIRYTELREGNKERQLLSDRIKEQEEKVKYLMKEVKLLNEELQKHQKIDYDIKAGQVAIALSDLFVLIFCHKHSKMMIKQTSKPCSFIRWKEISRTTKNFYLRLSYVKQNYVGSVFGKN